MKPYPRAPAAAILAQRQGLVVAAYGRRGLVSLGDERRPFVVKGRQLRVVCGDRVACDEAAGAGDIVITAVLPRSNLLARHDQRLGDGEPLAANLTQLIAVCAPRPEPDFFLVDRFFCAAELLGCRPVLVWNKCDLAAPDPAAVGDYAAIGYRVLPVSARSDEGMHALREVLDGEVSMLVGQSGVGKSSLVNLLAPGATAATGELSAGASRGTHTTTATIMYSLPGTGRLLDAPGTRSFLPAIAAGARIDRGFPELASLAPRCRFADCRHAVEPGCAVLTALETGSLPRRRYESFRRIALTLG